MQVIVGSTDSVGQKPCLKNIEVSHQELFLTSCYIQIYLLSIVQCERTLVYQMSKDENSTRKISLDKFDLICVTSWNLELMLRANKTIFPTYYSCASPTGGSTMLCVPGQSGTVMKQYSMLCAMYNYVRIIMTGCCLTFPI